MSKVYFISDLHLGHKNILEFAQGLRYGHNINEHDWWLVTQWNSVVTKQDTVYVLGDVAFDKEKLSHLGHMNGNKKLIMGNHDTFPLEMYQKYFSKIHAFVKYKEFFLTHCPMHEGSLFDRKNIHGHTHQRSLQDNRYINVSVEVLNGVPISYEKLSKKCLITQNLKSIQ